MRVFAFALASSILLATPAAAGPPKRVASLKLCTDELLLMLAGPGQIISVTHLSRNPLESPLWREARRYSSNDGSLLSVAAMAPDLVVDMGGGGRDSARIAKRLGIRLVNLPYPQGISDIEASVRILGQALGRPGPASRIVAQISELRRTSPKVAVDAAWLGGGGRSFAASGLGAEWMTLAGLRQRALPGDRLTLEQMLAKPPSLLLQSNYRRGQYSAEQKWLSHPLLARNRQSRSIETDGRRWTCMGPLMTDEILRLRGVARQ